MVTNGDLFLKGLIVIILSDVVSFFNVGKSMDSENQIPSTADLIIQEFPFLKVEDFKLCFNNAKKGAYGRLYDRLDGQIIFEWINTYCSERSLEAERININAHSELNNSKEAINPEIVNILKEVINTIQVEEVKKEPKKFSERDPRITALFNEFEKSYKKSGLYLNGSRFVKYNDKFLNQVEFLETKLKEGNAEM